MGIFDRLFGKKPAPEEPVPADPATVPPEDDWQDQGVPQELQPAEVRERLAAEPRPVLLDVREAPELQADGWIPGSVHIPMSELETRLGELDLSRPHIVYCASGMRSFDVGFLLIQNGCTDVANLNGGIRGWDGERETA